MMFQSLLSSAPLRVRWWSLLVLLLALGTLSAWLVWPLATIYKPTYVSMDVRTDTQAEHIPSGIELRWGDAPNQAVALTPRPGVHADPAVMYWDANLPALPISHLALRLTGGATRLTFIAIAIWTTPVQNWGAAQPLEQWAHLDGLTATSTSQGLVLIEDKPTAQLQLTAFTPITQQYNLVETPQTWLYNGFILGCILAVIGAWFIQVETKVAQDSLMRRLRPWQQRWRENWFKLTNTQVNILISGITLVTMTILALTSEVISINDGRGWDGVLYTNIAIDPYKYLPTITVYHVQRIFPSILVYGVSRLLFSTPTMIDILNLFSILNIIAITILTYFWCLTADELKISLRGKLLGWVGLFVNFAILKSLTYERAMTDYVAYALGMAMVYYYLRSARIPLFIVTLIGMFTWSTHLYLGCALLLFPKSMLLTTSVKTKSYLNYIPTILSFAAASYISVQILRYFSKFDTVYTYRYFSIVIFGIIISAAYVFFGFLYFVNDIKNIDKNIIYKFWHNKISIAAICFLLFVRYIQTVVTPPSDISTTFQLLWWTSVIYPGVFFVSHVLYFGPIIVFIPHLWKRICELISQQGIGITICIMLGVVLSLCSESRILINIIPFIIPFLVKAIEELELQSIHYWIFFVFSLLLSKFWMYIGPIDVDVLYTPSSQLYLMQLGPWMWPRVYIIQAFIVLLLLWFFGYVLYKQKLIAQTNSYKNVQDTLRSM